MTFKTLILAPDKFLVGDLVENNSKFAYYRIERIKKFSCGCRIKRLYVWYPLSAEYKKFTIEELLEIGKTRKVIRWVEK